MKKKVAVIGAGIVGATIGYSLAKQNVEVHFFDSLADTNDPTHYSLAWLNAFRKTPLDYFLFYNMGLHRWPWFHKEIGEGCDLTWGGALSVAVTKDSEKHLEDHLKPLYGWGYPVSRLEKNALQELEPNLSGVNWGAFCRDEGFVDADKCCHRLLNLAQKFGAKIHRPAKVTHLIPKGNRIHAIRINGNDLEFDDVVVACGAQVSDLAKGAGVVIPQRNIPAFFIRTEPCNQRFKNIAVLHIYSERPKDLRQNPDGSFWIAEVGNAGMEYPNPEEHAKEVFEEFTSIFKPAKGLSYMHQVITVPKPEDGKSLFGYAPGYNNLYIALSHSAVVICSVIGDWVAQEMLEGTSIHWLEQFRIPTSSSQK